MATAVTSSERPARGPVRAAKPTASLDGLIQQWRAECAGIDTDLDAYRKAAKAAAASLPAPDPLIELTQEAIDDGIPNNPVMLFNGIIQPHTIKAALEKIKPEQCEKRNTDEGMVIVWLKNPRPLSAEQIATKARLQKRLTASLAYMAAYDKAKAERGYKCDADQVVDRRGVNMVKIERKICKHRSRNAAELRAKLSFIVEAAKKQNGGDLNYFEDLDVVLLDALNLTTDLTNFTTRGH